MAESVSNSSTDAGPIYFWREFEEPYGFLSQWYESAFEHDGITYLSAEMWMMVQKAILFGDHVSTFCRRILLEGRSDYMHQIYIDRSNPG